MNIIHGVLLAAGTIIGIIIGIFLGGKMRLSLEDTKKKAEKLISTAQNHAQTSKAQAIEQSENIKKRIAENIHTHEGFLRDLEKSIKIKEDSTTKLDKRMQELQLQEAMENERLAMSRTRHEEIKLEQTKTLSQKAGKTTEALKEEIIKKLESDLKNDNEEKIKKIEEYYSENSEKLARNILLEAMQKVSMTTSTEKKSAQILVPKDSLKAALVGMRGENIRELENLLEINVIFNDFPDTISISSHSLLQRHIAEAVVGKLFANKKRITPTIIRETVKSSEAEAEKDIYKTGLEAIKKAGIHRQFPPELIKTIGRLYFRTSYGQNIMRHSMEVTYIANMLGGELGLDMNICKISGFLHDLGKAIDQDPGVTGGHDQITRDLMIKYGFTEDEIHAAWTHHEAEPPRTPEAMIIKAADAVSAGRPGARQESIGKYIERIRALEEISSGFQGVKKSFAMSAGREIRVLVDTQALGDESLGALAKDIAKKIEEEVGYPGKIKINVIRRTVTTEYTK